MQLDPIKSTLKAPGTKRSKLKYDELLPSFSFNLNMRRYLKGDKETKELNEKMAGFTDKVGRCRSPLSNPS